MVGRLSVRFGVAALLAVATLTLPTRVQASVPAVPAPLPTVLPGVGEIAAPHSGRIARLKVPVTLSGPSADVVSVDWTTEVVSGAPSTPEPQAPAADYRSVSGTIRFKAGVTSKTVTIPVTGDAAAQFEYVLVSFTDPVHATVGGAYGLGLGLIDPRGVAPAPTVSFVSVVNYQNGAAVTVGLSHLSAEPISVQYETIATFDSLGSWAEWVSEPGYFSPGTGTVVFSPGQATADISFVVSPTTVTGCTPFPDACYPATGVRLFDPVGGVVSSPTSVTAVYYTPT